MLDQRISIISQFSNITSHQYCCLSASPTPQLGFRCRRPVEHTLAASSLSYLSLFSVTEPLRSRPRHCRFPLMTSFNLPSPQSLFLHPFFISQFLQSVLVAIAPLHHARNCSVVASPSEPITAVQPSSLMSKICRRRHRRVSRSCCSRSRQPMSTLQPSLLSQFPPSVARAPYSLPPLYAAPLLSKRCRRHRYRVSHCTLRVSSAHYFYPCKPALPRCDSLSS